MSMLINPYEERDGLPRTTDLISVFNSIFVERSVNVSRQYINFDMQDYISWIE